MITRQKCSILLAPNCNSNSNQETFSLLNHTIFILLWPIEMFLLVVWHDQKPTLDQDKGLLWKFCIPPIDIGCKVTQNSSPIICVFCAILCLLLWCISCLCKRFAGHWWLLLFILFLLNPIFYIHSHSLFTSLSHYNTRLNHNWC